jgi:hypothetical protein
METEDEADRLVEKVITRTKSDGTRILDEQDFSFGAYEMLRMLRPELFSTPEETRS